jgi:flagellar biosynthesis/type III secretory pathway M-ring protein FliF/YscJ
VIHIIPTSQTTTIVATSPPIINDTSFLVILAIFILIFIWLIVREFRLKDAAKHSTQLEQDKLKIIQMDAATKAYPFTRLSPEQTTEIREVEDENITLETNIFAREKLVEKRLDRLENYVKVRKLDNMIGKIQTEEKKVK